jgi:drug/metabolite transporter (DMT)-like permease
MCGVLVVMRPGGSAFQPAALWGLGSAMSWAVATILTRKLSPAPAASMLLWSSVTGLVVLTMLLPFVFVPLSLADLAMTVLLGVVASSGQLLMVMAFRHAPASLLAPFSYLQLLWATFSGWLVFASLPDVWTLAGGMIIAASGLLAARSGAKRAVS